MPSPLPESVSATLRSDPTAALGALMVIASAHAELLDWVARMVCHAPPPARASTTLSPRLRQRQPQPKSSESRGAKSPAVRKPKSNGSATYLALRREARDRDDERLLEAMRELPEASIRDWAAAIGKSKTSTVAGLTACATPDSLRTQTRRGP